MRALIDLDPIKYKAGFASEKKVYQRPDGEYVVVRKHEVKGFEVITQEGVKFQHTGATKVQDVVDLENLKGPMIITDELSKCLHSVKLMVNRCLRLTGATSYTAFMSRGDCFRTEVYPVERDEDGNVARDERGKPIGYKANRISSVKPALMPDIEEYMERRLNAVICTEIEADDAICIEQCQSQDETIICTIDKDLRMCPGLHYNMDSGVIDYITPEQGMLNFWGQVLTGDAVDNIPGLAGVGKATAGEILDGVPVEQMKEVVLKEYIDRGHDEAYFQMNCKLLWMLRKPLDETYPDGY